MVVKAGAAVRTERDGPVLTVTIDRVARRNAFTVDVLAELWRIFGGFDQDETLRVAVLTGAGDRAFCAGRDLDELRSEGAADAARIARDRPAGAPEDWLNRLLPDVGKLTIAAVNGHAVGGGWALAQRCDLLIASAGAEFWLPEVRFGLGAGNFLVELVRVMPVTIAMELAQLGTHLTARRAHELGIVNRVVPAAEVVATAHNLARRAASYPPEAVRRNKVLVRRAAMPDRELLWDLAQSVLEPLRRGRPADIVDRDGEPSGEEAVRDPGIDAG